MWQTVQERLDRECVVKDLRHLTAAGRRSSMSANDGMEEKLLDEQVLKEVKRSAEAFPIDHAQGQSSSSNRWPGEDDQSDSVRPGEDDQSDSDSSSDEAKQYIIIEDSVMQREPEDLSVRAPLKSDKPLWSAMDSESDEQGDWGPHSEEEALMPSGDSGPPSPRPIPRKRDWVGDSQEEEEESLPPGPPPPVACKRPSWDTGAGDAEPREPGIYPLRERREGWYRQVSQQREEDDSEDDYWGNDSRGRVFQSASQRARESATNPQSPDATAAGDGWTMLVAAGAPCDVFNPWVGRCVGRGIRLGSENASGSAGGIWTFGNLEIWNLETWTCGVQKRFNYISQNQNPCHPKCRQGLDQ